MEELLCAEPPAACSMDGRLAMDDQGLLADPRVLDNLLALQPHSMPTQNYFTHIQTDVAPYMRKVVTTWMLEVVEEQDCEDQVFHVAVNFLDRFLCTCVVQRTQLQLIGATCLLLASKLRACQALSVELLSYYTDYSVSPEEIKTYEILLVSKLGWELSPVTAIDFVDHLLVRVPGLRQDPNIRKHTTIFIAFATTEPEFVQVPPSGIAVAAIVAAVNGMYPHLGQDALNTLAQAVNLDAQRLQPFVQSIELMVQRESAVLPQPDAHPQVQQQQHQQQLQQQPSTPTSKHPPTSPMEFFDGNETPTDITDIHF
ncbi:unnamed protein product [Meganyctiphanes norvegica]|uniref:Uncharacterized protein n=1 Tax=Meganyctiphanes norvegica TaxID=48144 RepID=A0AAV2Q8T4_MEGNR